MPVLSAPWHQAFGFAGGPHSAAGDLLNSAWLLNTTEGGGGSGSGGWVELPRAPVPPREDVGATVVNGAYVADMSSLPHAGHWIAPVAQLLLAGLGFGIGRGRHTRAIHRVTCRGSQLVSGPGTLCSYPTHPGT